MPIMFATASAVAVASVTGPPTRSPASGAELLGLPIVVLGPSREGSRPARPAAVARYFCPVDWPLSTLQTRFRPTWGCALCSCGRVGVLYGCNKLRYGNDRAPRLHTGPAFVRTHICDRM